MKNNKLIFLIILASIFCLSFDNPESKDIELEKTIFKVLNAYSEKDTSTLNELIHDKFGVYVLFRRGVFDEFESVMKIDFDNPIPEYLPYFGFELFNEIKYETLPKYSCETESWDKFGLFVDTSLRDNLLSRTAKNLVEYREDKIESNLISQFEEIESKSFRIILADKNGGEFVFYLTKLSDKWYLTIIDRVSSDCSA